MSEQKAWCEGGPPVSLLDHIREVVNDKNFHERYPEGSTAGDVLKEIHRRFPGNLPLVSVLDVADEMSGFYG